MKPYFFILQNAKGQRREVCLVGRAYWEAESKARALAVQCGETLVERLAESEDY